MRDRDTEVERACNKCGVVKPLTGFNKSANGKYGRRSNCRDCQRRYRSGYTAKNRERLREEQRRWRQENPDYHRRYNNSPERKKWIRDWTLRDKYGISLEDYEAMKVAQENRCAICARVFGKEKGSVANVDHCHTTGRVRGLLCGDCNRGIGLMGDDAARVRSAAGYLERYA